MNKAVKYISYTFFILFIFFFLLYHSHTEYIYYLYFIFILYVLVDDVINYPIAIIIFSYPIIIVEQTFVQIMVGYVPMSVFHTITRKLILVFIIIGISIIIGLSIKKLILSSKYFRNKHVISNLYENKTKFAFIILVAFGLAIFSYGYLYYVSHEDRDRVATYYKIVEYCKLSKNELLDIINSDNSDDALIAFLVLPTQIDANEIGQIFDQYCDVNDPFFCSKKEFILQMSEVHHDLFKSWDANRKKFSIEYFIYPTSELKVAYINSFHSALDFYRSSNKLKTGISD